MYYCAIPAERNIIRFSEYDVDGENINFGSHNSYIILCEFATGRYHTFTEPMPPRRVYLAKDGSSGS